MFQFGQDGLFEFLADARQPGFDGFLGCLESLGDFVDRAVLEIFRLQQNPFFSRKTAHAVPQEVVQIIGTVIIVRSREVDRGVLLEAFEEREITAALAVLVGSRAAGKHREPAPKNGFIGEDPDVTNDAPKRFLKLKLSWLLIGNGPPTIPDATHTLTPSKAWNSCATSTFFIFSSGNFTLAS
jgi:hypothetical protein